MNCNSYNEAIKMLTELEQSGKYSFGQFWTKGQLDNFPTFYYNHDVTENLLFYPIKLGDITKQFEISGKDITNVTISLQRFHLIDGYSQEEIIYSENFNKESNIIIDYPIINIAVSLTKINIKVTAESITTFKSLMLVLSNEDRRKLATIRLIAPNLTYLNGKADKTVSI